MALVLADRVQEYSTTTGTGTLTLSGAYAGFQTFAAGIGNGNTCYYTITSDTNQWEVGIGTVGVGTLARTTLISSSTSSLVSFVGTLTVFVTYPAEKAVYSDGTAIVAPAGALLPVTSGGTGASTAATARTALGLGTIATQDANNVAITGGAISGTTFSSLDNAFTLQNAADTTKKTIFSLASVGTGTTVTYAMTAVGGIFAVTNQTQTFTAANTFANTNNTFGSAATAGTQNLGTGATTTGLTKAINIGTNGLSGSTTNIAIGSSVSGSTSTTTMNGVVKRQVYTVATLPSASTSGLGATAFVSDALAPAFGATVVTGGAVAVPVYSDGTNWKVG